LCEQLAEAADEYGSGELQRDLYELLQPLLPKSERPKDANP
jgi:hypothetical protein